MTTPGQTVGPFFHIGMPYDGDAALVPADRADAVVLTGRVLDGDGAGVPDALVELWQRGPDAALVREPGSLRRDGRTFTGWGRCATDADGRYRFSTLAPGGPAPHFALTVFARGLLDRLFTRAYLPDVPDDALLAALTSERRSTLVAAARPDGFAFDIVLQGAAETVFLAHRT